jgi:hypothetical protein
MGAWDWILGVGFEGLVVGVHAVLEGEKNFLKVVWQWVTGNDY